MDILGSFSAVSGSSQQLVNLASAFLGGSIALLVGTSHISPSNKWLRMIYLLLLPCWVFLAVSILYGDLVLRKYLAATVVAGSDEKVKAIFQEANGIYASQLDNLRLAMLFFGIWLFAYIIWWVFFRGPDVGAAKP